MVTGSMKEFYERYNLNNYYFAGMAHVGAKTLTRYDQGKSIREDSKRRIDLAIKVVMENDLVRPRYTNGLCLHYRHAHSKFTIGQNDYYRRFEELLKEEESR